LARVVKAAQRLQAEKQQAERDAFVARVREEAAAKGLGPVEDLFVRAAPTPARKAASRARGHGVVPVQFRSPDGKHEWSGRGKTPGWLADLEKGGRSKEDFRVKEGQPDLIETARRQHGA
jgi:DNA-binding protein H-NS